MLIPDGPAQHTDQDDLQKKASEQSGRSIMRPEDEKCEFSGDPSSLDAFLSIFRGGLIAPTQMTYDSIHVLLTAETKEERDQLTRQWRDHKLQELNFIGVVGALIAGCLTGTGSWPTILQNGKTSPWPVRTCWYCGIVFALFGVLTAAQQSVRLHRLSGHRDALITIRHYMGKRCRDQDGSIVVRPRRFQVFGWQASIMFLTLAVMAMVLGMCILIWSSTQYGPAKSRRESWWDNNAKVSISMRPMPRLS